MYRTCIFCSADLGTNDAVEYFPVGRRVAFDATKGRLWAVCTKCGRWNLAPIEERWEAVEECERSFRDARMRVQTENIGMAKMRDGTKLIRIGAALPREIAAWRYGEKLVQRRRKGILVGAGAVIGGGGAIVLGFPLLTAALGSSAFIPIMNVASLLMARREAERVIMRVSAENSANGEELTIRKREMSLAEIIYDGEVCMVVPEPVALPPWYRFGHMPRAEDSRRITIGGSDARALAARAMVARNSGGASLRNVNAALDALQAAGSAERYIKEMARAGMGMSHRGDWQIGTRRPAPGWKSGPHSDVERYAGAEDLDKPRALALEMALHEESERRAMQGELAELEHAWREAEEIAHIADALPDARPES